MGTTLLQVKPNTFLPTGWPPSCAFDSDNLTHSLLVCAGRFYGTSVAPAIVDTNGNVWTRLFQFQVLLSYCAFYFCLDAKAGPNTVEFPAGAGVYPEFVIAEYANPLGFTLNAAATAFVSGAVGEAKAAGVWTTVPVASKIGDLVIAMFESEGVAVTYQNGLQYTFRACSSIDVGLLDKLSATTTSENPDTISAGACPNVGWGVAAFTPTPRIPFTRPPNLGCTIRDSIIDLAISYLSAATATTARMRPDSPEPPPKPAGLTVHREWTRPIETDHLPAILVYCDDEAPRSISSHYDAPLVERDLTVAFEFRAQPSTVFPTPDQAIDPLYLWAMYQIFANETFGGIVNVVVEGKTHWHSKEGDVPLASATTHLSIKYRTSRIDPSARS
jgi:hypothetical protein